MFNIDYLRKHIFILLNLLAIYRPWLYYAMFIVIIHVTKHYFLEGLTITNIKNIKIAC